MNIALFFFFFLGVLLRLDWQQVFYCLYYLSMFPSYITVGRGPTFFVYMCISDRCQGLADCQSDTIKGKVAAFLHHMLWYEQQINSVYSAWSCICTRQGNIRHKVWDLKWHFFKRYLGAFFPEESLKTFVQVLWRKRWCVHLCSMEFL